MVRRGLCNKAVLDSKNLLNLRNACIWTLPYIPYRNHNVGSSTIMPGSKLCSYILTRKEMERLRKTNSSNSLRLDIRTDNLDDPCLNSDCEVSRLLDNVVCWDWLCFYLIFRFSPFKRMYSRPDLMIIPCAVDICALEDSQKRKDIHPFPWVIPCLSHHLLSFEWLDDVPTGQALAENAFSS